MCYSNRAIVRRIVKSLRRVGIVSRRLAPVNGVKRPQHSLQRVTGFYCVSHYPRCDYRIYWPLCNICAACASGNVPARVWRRNTTVH